MTIRQLDLKLSLDTLWEELVYTRARLEADPHAADLAPPVRELIARTNRTRAAQLDAWEAEVVAQAKCDSADYLLDETVDEVARELDHLVAGDHHSPRWKRYFGQATPARVRRMALATELTKVEGWASSLGTEEDKPLRKVGTTLDAAVLAGREALARKSTASATRADHRAREILALFDDVNAARQFIFGTLTTRAQAAGQSRSWPGEFFRRKAGGGRQKAAPTPAPVSASPAPVNGATPVNGAPSGA